MLLNVYVRIYHQYIDGAPPDSQPKENLSLNDARASANLNICVIIGHFFSVKTLEEAVTTLAYCNIVIKWLTSSFIFRTS
jgi:hypothetical protein